MTDVSVCQTEGFQALWRFLRPFRNLQIMTKEKSKMGLVEHNASFTF
jgi:hypothetical protein